MSGTVHPVPVISDPAAMIAWAEAARGRGERIAFVPTMGYLHEGHMALLREGRRRGDRLVLSIFVNPTQFGPKEDLARYPRDLPGDLAKAAACGTDVAFVPEPAGMYPAGYQTYVEVRGVQAGLCGDRRPGHFVGVATVVLKLFNVVRPHLTLFGDKDFQQLAVIRRMVLDLNVPVEIAGLPTVREPDGLAMSSRNAYLSPADRRRAVGLSAGLFAAKRLWDAGERRAGALLEAARAHVLPAIDRLDYLELHDADTLAPIEDAATIERAPVLLVAAFVGGTRLIDNVRF